MAILAYLSGRRAALRGSGMRSNFADSFRATHLQSGLRTQAHPLENRAPIAQTSEPSQRAPNRTGTVAHDLCAGPVRTTCAHDLCASSLSNISFVTLWLGHYHGRFQCSTRGGVRCSTRGGVQCCTREGVQCCTRGGQNGGSDPPVCAFHSAPDPRGFAHHAGPVPPSLRGVAPAIVILAGRLGLRRAETA